MPDVEDDEGERDEQDRRRHEVGEEDQEPGHPRAGEADALDRVGGEDRGGEREHRRGEGHDHRVPEPARVGGLEEKVLDVLERRPDHPERAVLGVVGQLVVRFDGGDRHPVEREQQHEHEDRQRQVDDEDPPRERVVLLHADDVVDRRRRSRCRRPGPRRRSRSPGRSWPSVRSPLLPLPALQSEEAEQDRREQERDHRDGDRRALAELAAGDRALEARASPSGAWRSPARRGSARRSAGSR